MVPVAYLARVDEDAVRRGSVRRPHVDHGESARATFGKNEEPIVQGIDAHHSFGRTRVFTERML